VAIAGLAVAILGTVLNDGGISVWLTATAAYAVTIAWFVLDDLARQPPMPTAPARPTSTSSPKTGRKQQF
jgi:hypothetical protein